MVPDVHDPAQARCARRRRRGVFPVKATALRIALGLVIGGALGYGWHRLVGCSTGTCPLTATPLRGISYGAVLGLIWALAR
nr:DUF6132 family protein [Geothrix fuzhouensis]